MKRPEYIEIAIDLKGRRPSAAVKRYFTLLEGKVLKINFGEMRVKKVFQYNVISSGIETWSSWSPRKQNADIKIRARLQQGKVVWSSFVVQGKVVWSSFWNIGKVVWRSFRKKFGA